MRLRSARFLVLTTVVGALVAGLPAPGLAQGPDSATAVTTTVRAAWWAAFEDTRLDALMVPLQLAAEPDAAALLQTQGDIVRAYVRLRVAGVRLHTARMRLQLAEQRQLALQTAADAGPDAVQAAQRSLREARQTAERLQTERLHRVADVAALLRARHPAELLGPLLRAASEETQMLLPRFHLLNELPGVVLRHRPDVARAEAALAMPMRGHGETGLEMARYLQAMSQPIRASEQPPRRLRLPMQGVGGVMEKAREEIAFNLWEVGSATVATREQHAHVARLAAVWQHLSDQQASGRVSELQALEAMDEALQAEDQLAVRAGELARAWVALQLSVGGLTRQTLESVPEGNPAR